MVRYLLPAVCILLLGGLIGCNPVNPISSPTALEATSDLRQATRTPAAQIPPSPTAQPNLIPTPSPLPRATQALSTPLAVISPTPTRICNLAAAGRPIDVTIPDDTRVGPGDSFVKTWRLVNVGSCEWTRGYAAVWFSGMDMGGRREEPIRAVVSPNQSVDISVDMSAPQQAGVYQSNWKLRDEQGNLFGIGPAGNSPFWARIEVVAIGTPLPETSSDANTAVPGIYGSGSIHLSAGQTFDFDAGSPGSGGDLLLDGSASQFEWIPQNGARVGVFGVTAPSFNECRSMELQAGALQIAADLEGQFLCMTTDQNLPGSVQFLRVEPSADVLDLRYLVWTVP